MAEIMKLAPIILLWEAGAKYEMTDSKGKPYTLPLAKQWEYAVKKGYSNRPDDLGVPTFCGITLKTYKAYCKRKWKPTSSVYDLRRITLDIWLYCTSYSSNYSFKWIFTLDRSGSTTGDEGNFSIRVRTTGKIEFSYRQNNAWHDTNTGITLPLNSWHHLCCVRANNVIMFFLDGIKQFETAMTARLMINQNTFVDIGNNYSNSAGNQRAFNGMIDEFRLVIGTAAWTSDFTPPTEEYLM